ncbi:MAG: hypothetical protein AAF414_08325, partial [Pseudomonadota bacterium]
MPDGSTGQTDARLATLDQLARAIPFDSWFAAVGDPLIGAERDEARLYLDGLGFPDAVIAGIDNWHAAHASADAPDWDPAWWTAEDTERARLLKVAEESIDERALY